MQFWGLISGRQGWDIRVLRRSAREFRRLFGGAYGVLLACCALVAVLWTGSHRSLTQIRLPVVEGGTRWSMTSYRGIVAFAMVENHPTGEALLARIRRDDAWTAAQWDEQAWSGSWAGLTVDDSQIWLRDADNRRVPRQWTSINIPYWLLFAVSFTGPLHGLFVACRACRRSAHDQCGACGYALGGGTTCQACAARASLIGASPRVRLVRTA
jgi:hypothetical protein